MERIIIKELIKKDSGLCVVKYNGNRTATLARWQGQEIDYLENDVGIGGSVEVVITVKGDYTNITEVKFDSAQKNTATTQSEKVCDVPQSVGLMSQKDISIVSQVLIKGAFYAKGGSPQEVLDAYRFFVKELEENG